MQSERRPSNIEIVFSDWLDAIRRGDLDCIANALHPDAVHQGIRPEWVCANREEILENVAPRVANPPQVDALELVASGDQVVMSVRGPGIGPPIDEDTEDCFDQATIVFTLHGGKITRMQDFVFRHEALDAAQASPRWD